jgi:hypothetical protein
MLHAKPVLLIDDREAELRKLRALDLQRVCADGNYRLAAREPRGGELTLLGLQ